MSFNLVKIKVTQLHAYAGTEWRRRYGSNPFATSALEGGGWPASRPGVLPPGKTRYPLRRRLGGPRGRSGRARKISHPPVFDPWTVQPVASDEVSTEGRYIHTYIPTYIHTYVHTYLHTYIHTYVHTYIHTHIHTYK